MSTLYKLHQGQCYCRKKRPQSLFLCSHSRNYHTIKINYSLSQLPQIEPKLIESFWKFKIWVPLRCTEILSCFNYNYPFLKDGKTKKMGALQFWYTCDLRGMWRHGVWASLRAKGKNSKLHVINKRSSWIHLRP